jgi:hypothetical protein
MFNYDYDDVLKIAMNWGPRQTQILIQMVTLQRRAQILWKDIA